MLFELLVGALQLDHFLSNYFISLLELIIARLVQFEHGFELVEAFSEARDFADVVKTLIHEAIDELIKSYI